MHGSECAALQNVPSKSDAMISSPMARKVLPIAAGVMVAGVASALANRWLTKRAERRNPPIGQFITVQGVLLHYVERGTGTPLILLHGNGSMIEDFESSGLIDLAAKQFRVIVFDRPGFGHSERPRATIWTPEAQATLIAAALKKIGVSKAIILGHSWGTLVSLALAINYPQLVQSFGFDLRILLSERASRCGSHVTSGHTVHRRRFESHHLSFFEQADVAIASSQDFWSEPGSG